MEENIEKVNNEKWKKKSRKKESKNKSEIKETLF